MSEEKKKSKMDNKSRKMVIIAAIVTILAVVLVLAFTGSFGKIFVDNKIPEDVDPTDIIELKDKPVKNDLNENKRPGCGNGIVDEGETWTNCRDDLNKDCGNGICEEWETYVNCGDCPYCIDDRFDEVDLDNECSIIEEGKDKYK